MVYCEVVLFQRRTAGGRDGQSRVGGALTIAGAITINTLVTQEGVGLAVPFRDLKKTTQILPVSKLRTSR